MLKIFLKLFCIGLVCLPCSRLLSQSDSSARTSTVETINYDDEEKKLCELASHGQLSEEIITAFYQYAQKKTKEKIQASDEFWNWLSGNEHIYRGLLVGLHPEYNPYVVTHLRELRDTFGPQLSEYPHLGLAFAFVYGAAKGQTIRAPWMSWVEKNREVPSCTESFVYYINNNEKMLYSLKELPWPLLLYVADNDVPISERQWVLSHCVGRSITDLSKLHSEPNYIKGYGARKRKDLDGAPMALPRIIDDGGVCSQQAYYASRVFKCLGVPSVRLLERLHAYEGWVVADQGFKVQYAASFGRQDGYYLCPLTRNKNWQYEFDLRVASMNHSYDQYLKSTIASHLFKMLPDSSKKQAKGLLQDAIQANPCVIEPWQTFAQACENGIFTIEEGRQLYRQAKKLLPDHPGLGCLILNQLTMAQLNNHEMLIPEEQYSQTKNMLNETLAWLRKQKQIDMAGNILQVHADYMMKAKGVDTLIARSLEWLETKDLKTWNENLFKHVLTLAKESNNDKALEKLIKTEYQRLVLLARKSQKPQTNPYHVTVANAYSAYWQEKGNLIKASEILLELDQLYRINLTLGDPQDIISRASVLGAVEKQVSAVVVQGEGCYVWQILYDLPEGTSIRLSAKHADAGKKGAFYLTAWADKNHDGVPDTRIGISPLLTADRKDQWSNWQFESTDKTIFVGMARKVKSSFYYQNGGELPGYCGLSDRVFHTRKFDQPPQNTTRQRYANLRVEITGQIKNGKLKTPEN